MNSWCKKIGELIEVPSLHPHDFRHSYATLMKNSGIDLESISEMLNHASVDVTKKFYIKSDSSKIRKLKDSVNI